MDFNINVRVKFKAHKRARMGIWQAMEMLNTLVDESDPDVSTALHHLSSSTCS
jgi:inositol oxygenase